VAVRGHLPDLPPQLRRLERRRDRRPAGDHRPARPPQRRHPGLAWGRRDLAVAVLPLADGRLRLRRGRLHRRGPDLRHPGRLRPAGRRGPRPRHPGHRRPGAQPQLRPAPLVPRVAVLPRQPQARLVRLGRPQAGRLAAQQLDQLVPPGRTGVDLRRADRPVLPAFLHPPAARPQLVEPGGPGGHGPGHALLAGARRRRLPGRRRPQDGPRPRPARQPPDRPRPGSRAWPSSTRSTGATRTGQRSTRSCAASAARSTPTTTAWRSARSTCWTS
jgi:hypothetical protein